MSDEFDAYGNCTVTVNTVENPLRFPGQYHDKETGLYYNLNRYYDPKIGRYLQIDSAGDGLNPYVYAAANPVNAIDPDGLCAVRMISGIAEIGVGFAIFAKTGGLGSVPAWLLVVNGAGNFLGGWKSLLAGEERYGPILEAPIHTAIPNEMVADTVYLTTQLAIGYAGMRAAAKLFPESGLRFKTPSMTDTDGTWKRLGKGVRIKRVGNYWIKGVDPEASRFWRWWGRVSLNAQARGLKRIGDMAPEFTYTNGQLRISHINKFTGSRFQAWKVSLKVKWRLKTIFDDAHIGNIGAGGIVFDPSVHPVMHTVYWTGSIGTGIGAGSGLGYLYYSSRGE